MKYHVKHGGKSQKICGSRKIVPELNKKYDISEILINHICMKAISPILGKMDIFISFLSFKNI
jgi:hypothetical protein